MTNYMDEIIKDSIPIWEECLNSNFVYGLVNGNLTDEQITKYLIEDTRYLLNYAKCFALLISKCNTLEEIRNYYDILGFVKEGEASVRRKFLQEHNLDEELVETTIPDPINQGYIDALLSWCSNGSLIEGTMSLLPCMLSYTYIFNKYYKEHPNMLKGNKFDYILVEYIGKDIEELTNVCLSVSV